MRHVVLAWSIKLTMVGHKFIENETDILTEKLEPSGKATYLFLLDNNLEASLEAKTPHKYTSIKTWKVLEPKYILETGVTFHRLVYEWS